MEKLPTPPLIRYLYAHHYAHIIASKMLIVWEKNQSSDSSSDSHTKKNLKTHMSHKKLWEWTKCGLQRSPRLCAQRRQWQPTLAWKIPWTEDPGGLQSMGSRRVGHNWVTSLLFFTFIHWRMKWQPTPVFLPGESQGRWSLVGRTESDTTETT